MRTLPSLAILPLALAVAVFTGAPQSQAVGKDDLGPRDRDELLRYARDTWRSVAEMAAGDPLPADGLLRQSDGSWKPSQKTTPTDIGPYLWSTLAAEHLQIIGKSETERRMKQTLEALKRPQRIHGFFCDKIDPSTCAVVRVSPTDGSPQPLIVSCVDNGWLAVGLIMVRNSCPALRAEADELVNAMEFSFFYVPYDDADPVNHPGQVHGPYHLDQQSFGGFQKLLNTEQRIYSYIGIARGQLPAELYYRLGRTLKPGEEKQRQTPMGATRTYLNVPVFEGNYTYRGMRIVPSWGGSMFEALMATLYNDHGFLDSVNVSNGKLASTVLMLDQGMIMAAIANALADDAMRRAFVDERIEKKLAPLIGMEEFTAGRAPGTGHTSTHLSIPPRSPH